MALSPAIIAAAREFDDTIDQGRRAEQGVLRIQPSEREQIEAQWKFVAPALQRFLERVVGQSALQNFAVSRDYSEISARFRDDSKRGYCYVMLSRRRPDERFADGWKLWLTTIGGTPAEYADAVSPCRELIRRILAASV